MKQPLLSIVVPTKDRYYYLKFFITLIQSFETDDIELVIQDNTEDNHEILSFINTINYNSLKYFHTIEQIPVAENADKGILNSCGEYVCLLGDDDGVTRHIVNCVKWMKINKFDVLRSTYSIYKWSTYKSPKHYNVSATAQHNPFSQKYYFVDCKTSLNDLFLTGIDTMCNLPKVYNGIVKRSVLDIIYEKCGTFHPGPSPDMANATALMLVINNFVYVDAPIIIGGHSGQIGGNINRYKNKYGPLEDQPFISQWFKDNWNKKIPKIWSSRSVWPESAITALNAFGREDLVSLINYEVIYRKFIIDHPDIASLAYGLSENRYRLFFQVILHKFTNYYARTLNYLDYKINNRFEGHYITNNVSDIIEAEHVFSSAIESFCPIPR